MQGNPVEHTQSIPLADTLTRTIHKMRNGQGVPFLYGEALLALHYLGDSLDSEDTTFSDDPVIELHRRYLGQFDSEEILSYVGENDQLIRLNCETIYSALRVLVDEEVLDPRTKLRAVLETTSNINSSFAERSKGEMRNPYLVLISSDVRF